MTAIFVDAIFWIARLSRGDRLHALALKAENEHGQAALVTTSLILTEVLNALSSSGPSQRRAAADFAVRVRQNAGATCIEVDSDLLSRGIALYRERPDKDWSLIDCVSFLVMGDRAISQALTFDGDFTQAGFVTLPGGLE